MIEKQMNFRIEPTGFITYIDETPKNSEKLQKKVEKTVKKLA